MEELNPVSYGTNEALDGLKRFLKENKSKIPYRNLDVNLYTIARNVLNDRRLDPTELSDKELVELKDAMLTELAYLNNILDIDVAFYIPKINISKEETEKKKKKITKSILNQKLAIKLAKYAFTKVKTRKPMTGSIILTNSLAGITDLNNPILRSFTGEVIFKQQYYKLLKRTPPAKVNKKLLKIFGDDFLDGIKGKFKEVNKLLGLIKESPFKPSLEIKELVNSILEEG